MIGVSKYKWALVSILAVAVLLAAFVLADFSTSTAKDIQPDLIVSKSIGNAEIQIFFDSLQQRIDAGVNYNYLSLQELQAYVELNQKLAQELAQREHGSLYVKICFNRLLNQAEFEAFVGRYELQVKSYFMRAVQPDGRLAGIGGAPSQTELVPKRMLNTAMMDMSSRAGTRFKGWAYVTAITDPAHLRLVLQDPDVLAIEGVGTLIFDELTPEILRKAGATQETIQQVQADMGRPTVQITGPGLYRALEKLGLAPVPEY